MDPGPCPCATARLVGAGAGGDGSDPNVRMSHVVGKRKAEGAAGDGGEEEPQIGREPYNPPVLWPVNGEKFAFQRDRGPVAHGLRLESAYAQQADAWGTGEPAFSSYHHMFKVPALCVLHCGGRLSLMHLEDSAKFRHFFLQSAVFNSRCSDFVSIFPCY